MKSSLKIGSVMGIPIKLHITFLLILPIFAYVFAINPQPFGFRGVEPAITKYSLSVLTAILLFASIVLHELAHSYMAMRYGVKIESITLFLFGGVSAMEEMPRKPGEEAKMASAGPLTSLVIGFVCLFIYGNLISPNPALSQNPVYLTIWILGVMNLVLGIFNLLPAFPMDGGRVLRSFYARRMSYVKATQSAASVGKFFAILMAIFGILIGNLWFPLIALFIYVGASEEERSTRAEVTLENIFVRDIMTRDVVSVSPSMNVEDLVKFMFEKKHMGYPVMEGDSLKGVVTFTDIQKVPYVDRPVSQVSDIMSRNIISVPPDAQASDVLRLVTSKNIGRVMVIDNGSVVGILSRTDLVRILRLRSE
ncbi:CBS domain-containing protein [Methanosarcina sp. MSH10X1]|uniref:CBS domain-containing protein n=1 Tax=Methanosarcina sp. MSH10X1 TaxID=2507075 RepID=UPI000FFBEB24|nr:CBS domain-containing protein [Methanosarcina sp. MSH10X1]RXA18729.1 CBS domain-containing protein [Methanosarcina sp. MSH10X1]